MRTSTIRLIGGDGNFLHWTGEDDARQKLRSGFWQEVYDRASGRFRGIQKIEFLPRSSDTASSCAITARESLLNVGVWDGLAPEHGGTTPEGRIDAAREKVQAYAYVADDLAVLASCLAPA